MYKHILLFILKTNLLGGFKLKEFLIKSKWIYKYSRPFLLGIIIITLLGVVSSLGNIYKALIMKKLIDNAISIHINNMIQNLVLFGVIIIADILLQSLCSILSTKIYTKMHNNIQSSIFTHTLNVKWIELSKYHSGDILTRITSDADSVTNLIMNTIPSVISLSVLLIGSFITLFYFDPLLAVIAFLFSPAIVLIGRVYSIKLKKIYKLLQEIESKYRSLLHESIQNTIILKSFCMEKNTIKVVTNLQENRLKLKLSQNNINVLNNMLFSTSSWTTFFIIFTWGAYNLSMGSTTYGTMSALLQLFGNVQYPFMGLASSIPKTVATMTSIGRLMELQRLQLDSSNNSLIKANNVGLEFSDVSFSYKQGLPIIDNLSLKINSGETIAVIGPSGEGKTTLIRLLLSLVYPERGHIFITNNNEKIEIDASCRNLISYVPQGNTLFSGTIAENLRYGNKDATDEELKIAASDACVWDFIEGLDEGLNTIVGERGLGLSEGQAQRLAIARALLKKAPVLILDEATSALDTDTEIKVLQAIHNLNPIRTCIIITHRPTALKICNKVYKLDCGHLIELHNDTHQDVAIEII